MNNHKKVANFLILQSNCLGITKDELSTAFIYACRIENDDLLYALIEHGVDVNFKWNEAIPLNAAVRENNIELLGSLTALGADVELRGRFSYTPLMLVALDGNPRMLSALLAFGAYIHASSIDGGQSVFSSAEFGTENEHPRRLLSSCI